MQGAKAKDLFGDEPRYVGICAFEWLLLAPMRVPSPEEKSVQVAILNLPWGEHSLPNEDGSKHSSLRTTARREI